jgi:purine-binding chemotaxis protein CheW
MSTATIETPAPELPRALAGKHLIFRVGGESCGIPVLRVREIIRLTHITPVPRMPEAVKGVINLRGRIIPVLDLRVHFGVEAGADSRHACIIVVAVESTSGARQFMGLVVDAVEEVANLRADDIEPPPDFGAGHGDDCILGMAKSAGRVKTLLNIDRVVAASGWSPPSASGAGG